MIETWNGANQFSMMEGEKAILLSEFIARGMTWLTWSGMASSVLG